MGCSRLTTACRSYVVLKKTGKAAAKATEEDAFDEGFADDDLFGGATLNQAKVEFALPKPKQERASKVTADADAKAAKRAPLFEAERKELLFCLASDCEDSRLKARKTAIRSIVRWTDTTSQLRMVMD